MLEVFKPVARNVSSGLHDDGLSGWTAVVLGFHIHPGIGSYIEWPDNEPMENVLALICQVENGSKGSWRTVFDLSDEGLVEVLVGGYRLHGMFFDDLKEEE